MAGSSSGTAPRWSSSPAAQDTSPAARVVAQSAHSAPRRRLDWLPIASLIDISFLYVASRSLTNETLSPCPSCARDPTPAPMTKWLSQARRWLASCCWTGPGHSMAAPGDIHFAARPQKGPLQAITRTRHLSTRQASELLRHPITNRDTYLVEDWTLGPRLNLALPTTTAPPNLLLSTPGGLLRSHQGYWREQGATTKMERVWEYLAARCAAPSERPR